MRRQTSYPGRAAVRIALAALCASAALLADGDSTEWTAFGATGSNTRYSPLDQIDQSNFGDLEVAWTWQSISTEVTEINRRVRAGQFKVVPLKVGALLFVATELSQVAAIDAATGETVWTYDPKSYEDGRPAN
ncbi:MAG: hypothetical protein VYE73_13680, partial [Acidobacteriota bacterium]|nr:hypothetical protein [Acidobacteriota bacterium]